MNLFNFVENPFTKRAELDEDLLYGIFYEAIRMGDNIVDLEIEHIDRIIKKIKNDPQPDSVKQTELELWEKVREAGELTRRVGVGITALADMTAALGIRYGSEEHIELLHKLGRIKLRAELDATTDLGLLRGTFPEHDGVKELVGNDWYTFIEEEFPEQFGRMIKYGRRNISTSTVAPTGSVSLLTQTTSGCEPLFSGYHMRRKKVNPNDSVKVDFVDDLGDSWTEHPVLHPKLKNWLGVEYKKDIEEVNHWISTMDKEELDSMCEASPWHGSTANDLDWQERVNVQAVLQKYTTHSISSTVNLPEDVTVETVSNIYMEAWKQGCKGVTVYVDGSRDGVLVTESTEKFKYFDALKRPPEIIADAHTTSVRGDKFSVFVGTITDLPYELFVFSGSTTEGKGYIKKNGKGDYVFIPENGNTRQITAKMTEEQAALARMISTALRHGTSPKYIVDQLDKSAESIGGFNKALVRVLKKYIVDGDEATGGCPECGGELIYAEGCKSCGSGCGYSAC